MDIKNSGWKPNPESWNLDKSVLFVEQNKSKKASCLPLSVAYNHTSKYKKHTSTTLAPFKNKLNIRGHILINHKPSIS